MTGTDIGLAALVIGAVLALAGSFLRRRNEQKRLRDRPTSQSKKN